MSQVSRAGPRRKIVSVRSSERQYKYWLTLECGHEVPRHLLRIQRCGMARCLFCAGMT